MTNAPLRIEEVYGTTGLRDFLRFPLRRYQNDPYYIPPLEEWVRRRLSPKNTFWKEASIKLFLARRGGEVVGTISALRDRRHEEHRGERVAFFGFFECLDDPAIASALLEKAESQARSWGLPLLRGPRNLSRVEETGFLVEGFSSSPPMLAGHHPSSYHRMIEDLGYTKHHDVLAYEAMFYDEAGLPRPLPQKLKTLSDAVDIPGLEVRPARLRSLSSDLDLAYEVFVEAFRDVPENTPMPRAQFLNLGRALLAFANRNLLQLATVGGKAAGFALCFPELNEAIGAARGRLFPGGWLRFLSKLPRIKTASFKLIGVMPEYRSKGLHARLIERAIEGMREAGYRRLEASLVDERNVRMRRVVEDSGLTVYRRYRIYERAIS